MRPIYHIGPALFGNTIWESAGSREVPCVRGHGTGAREQFLCDVNSGELDEEHEITSRVPKVVGRLEGAPIDG